MAKSLFLIILSSFIGVFASAEFLTAADSVTAGQPDFDAVETVEVVEPEVEEASVATTNYTSAPARTAPVYTAPVYTAPANNIAIAGRTLEIVDVADTTVDSGNHVNKYGGKFLYGHNSGAVFGSLVNLGVGSTFTVTYGGTVTNYQVAKVMIYEKNTSNGRLQLNGSGNYMRGVANAVSDGVHYDLSIMTCYGTSYGNGDASHRLVLYAYAR